MRGQGIGLAVIGCGTVGRIRAVLAREHPAVEWIGLCDIDADTAKALGEDVAADFVTSDLDELLTRPEVTAVIVATAENEHVAPILAAVQLGKPLFIEKPLATNPAESARVLEAVESAGIDAVMRVHATGAMQLERTLKRAMSIAMFFESPTMPSFAAP